MLIKRDHAKLVVTLCNKHMLFILLYIWCLDEMQTEFNLEKFQEIMAIF